VVHRLPGEGLWDRFPVIFTAQNPPSAEVMEDKKMSQVNESVLQMRDDLNEFRGNLKVGDEVWWEDEDPDENASGVFTVSAIRDELSVAIGNDKFINLSVSRYEIFQPGEASRNLHELRMQKAKRLMVFRENLNIGDAVWWMDENSEDFTGKFEITDVDESDEFATLYSEQRGSIEGVYIDELYPDYDDGPRLCLRSTVNGDLDRSTGKEWIVTACGQKQLRGHALLPNTNPVTHRVCKLCQMVKWGETFDFPR
jgi:hypothetical protein